MGTEPGANLHVWPFRVNPVASGNKQSIRGHFPQRDVEPAARIDNLRTVDIQCFFAHRLACTDPGPDWRGAIHERGFGLARRSREAIQKRLRERKRAEKAALKRQKRLERKKGLAPGEGELEAGGIMLAGQTEAVEGEEATGEAAVAGETVAAGEPAAAGEVETDDQPPLQEDLRQLHPTTD